MTRNDRRSAVLRPLPLVCVVALITGCRSSAGKDDRKLGTELTASQLERQIRRLDSIEAVLRNGPGGVRADSAAAYATSGSGRRPTRADMEPLALPDSQSARNLSTLTVTTQPTALRSSPLQMVTAPAGLAPAPVPVPTQVLAPLWALAPLAGATSVARATATATTAVVPEPGSVGLLASGMGLIAAVTIVRRRRRNDPERVTRAD